MARRAAIASRWCVICKPSTRGTTTTKRLAEVNRQQRLFELDAAYRHFMESLRKKAGGGIRKCVQN